MPKGLGQPPFPFGLPTPQKEGGAMAEAKMGRGPKGKKCAAHKTVSTKKGPAKRCARFRE